MPCVDYQKFYDVMTNYSYLLPCNVNMTDVLSRTQQFSTSDLGYWEMGPYQDQKDSILDIQCVISIKFTILALQCTSHF